MDTIKIADRTYIQPLGVNINMYTILHTEPRYVHPGELLMLFQTKEYIERVRHHDLECIALDKGRSHE